MFKKSLVVLLAVLLLQLVAVPAAAANTKAEKQAQLTEKVKAGIARLGVGPAARVEVTLRDRTKLAGYVSEVRDESFVVANVKSGATTNVAYADVTQVKGHNLSTAAKVGIGIGIGIVVLAIMIYLIHPPD